MIDGMDQKKMCLPHLKRLPKDLNDECLVQMHLVGCLAYNGTIKPHVFITYPNVHTDPNRSDELGASVAPCSLHSIRQHY